MSRAKVFEPGQDVEIQRYPGAAWERGKYVRVDPETLHRGQLWHHVLRGGGSREYLPSRRVRHPLPVRVTGSLKYVSVEIEAETEDTLRAAASLAGTAIAGALRPKGDG